MIIPTEKTFIRILAAASCLFLALTVGLTSAQTPTGGDRPIVGSPAALAEQLKNSHNSIEQRELADALAKHGRTAVPVLTRLLGDNSSVVRREAAYALGAIGPEAGDAIPELRKALSDNVAGVRAEAAAALGQIGTDARGEINPLAGLLRDPNADVRVSAVHAISRIGIVESDASPGLVRALVSGLHDEQAQVRIEAAKALARCGVGAKSSIPDLTKSLSDTDQEVRETAAASLARISSALYDAKDASAADDLRAAHTVMLTSRDAAVRAYDDEVSRAFNYLEAQNPTIWTRVKSLPEKQPFLTSLLGLYFILALGWLFILDARPLLLLRLNEALKSSVNIETFGVRLNVVDFTRYLSLLALFYRQPKVLDAWVAKYIKAVRASFQGKEVVAERGIYVPLPATLNRENVDGLTLDQVRPTFERNVACLLVWGEGGSGKTTFACQLARWAMSEDAARRLNTAHLMIPVLLDPGVELRGDGADSLVKAVQDQLRVSIDELTPPSPELTQDLLRRKRVMVVVDGFSDMSEEARASILAGVNDIPVNALVVTSRLNEPLNGLSKSVIKTQGISGNRLAVFLEEYLHRRGKRELFSDEEFFKACSQLLQIAGDRDITPLFIKLLVEQLIAAKEGVADDSLPGTLPDLILLYLSEKNRGAGPNEADDRQVLAALEALAWASLKRTYRAQPLRRGAAVEVLESRDEAFLEYLETKLQVIQSLGPDRERICFTHDSLAEYLAGMYLLKHFNRDEGSWREFLNYADIQEGAPESIKGFLLALRDCALANGGDYDVPDFLIDALAKRAGLSSDDWKRRYTFKRIGRLEEELRLADADGRAFAAIGLGRIGPGAKAVIPSLLEALKDADADVRRAAAEAIRKIDSRVNVTAETLLEVERANEQMLELMDIPGSPLLRPGLRVAHSYRRATSISGDFYNFVPRGDGSVGIYMVDVEGHGISASQQAQAIKQVISRPGLEWGAGRARQQLELADKLVSEELGARNVAATMNFTELHPTGMTIRHANAGMPFPLLFRRGYAQPEVLQAAGVYVGAGYRRYPVKPEEVEVAVGDGDLLVLCSDGIIEARDDKDRLFGQGGIIAAVTRARYNPPEAIADEILRAADEHTGRKNPEDDQTLIVVQIGQPVEDMLLEGAKTIDQVGEADGVVEVSLMNAGDTGFAAHEHLRERVIEWAQSHGFDGDRAREIWVATWEAVQNAVKHGSSRGDVIHIHLNGGSQDALQVELVQPQLWRSWDAELGDHRKAMLQNTQEIILGGTVIMLRLADEIKVSNQGRRINMKFSRPLNRLSFRL